MLEQEKEPILCYECDIEFVIHTAFEHDEDVSFCPFCGSEVEADIDFETSDDDQDDEDHSR
jgi:rRNA maturation endonuclease Nob1